MDPQATLQRILDCRDCNDLDGFNESFVDLRDWLAKGGFAPIVTAEAIGSSILIARLPNRIFHIQVVVESGIIVKPVRYEFAEYAASTGMQLNRWELR